MKPLFIPLKAEWFNAFKAGTKATEYRAYGPRWNEGTCRIGRRVTLAYGYGWPRLEKRVLGFDKLPWDQAPQVARDFFPKAQFIAAIHLSTTKQAQPAALQEYS